MITAVAHEHDVLVVGEVAFFASHIDVGPPVGLIEVPVNDR
jgi:hypothetical protein